MPLIWIKTDPDEILLDVEYHDLQTRGVEVARRSVNGGWETFPIASAEEMGDLFTGVFVDLNKDGRTDVVTGGARETERGNREAGIVFVPGEGPFTLGEPQTIWESDIGPRIIGAGDFDGNGLTDIFFVENHSGSKVAPNRARRLFRNRSSSPVSDR